jgi:ferredoxin-NADP reductase/ferredoxin
MPRITYAGQSYECRTEESVLQCLGRHGVEPPSSCRSGVCQTCLMKATVGTPPIEAQAGLKTQLQMQGYFLACICIPNQDMTIVRADETALPQITTTLIEKRPLNQNIMRIRLKPETSFSYHPGQFINLHRDNDTARCYSIASLPNDEAIELHVEWIKDGKVSGWLHNEVNPGDTIKIDGPHGDCFYTGDNPQENIMLAGTGSGLAPLWGILQDALARGHQGQIHLFHGSRTAERLYLVEELRTLAQQKSNFHYTACVSGPTVPEGYEAGRCPDIALKHYPNLDSSWRLFLCGHPAMVNDMRKRSFLAGASFNNIHADPFTHAS